MSPAWQLFFGLVPVIGCVLLISLEYRGKLVLLGYVSSICYLKVLALYSQLSVLYLHCQLSIYNCQPCTTYNGRVDMSFHPTMMLGLKI